MRKITIQYLGKVKDVPLVSSRRDGLERIIKIKGLFDHLPNRISTGILSVKQNEEFENGNYARVKGGIFKVKRKDKHLLKVKVPAWQAYLYISLFNADGGDGYSNEEITEAEKFINEKKLASLVEVSEQIDDEIICTFSRRY